MSPDAAVLLVVLIIFGVGSHLRERGWAKENAIQSARLADALIDTMRSMPTLIRESEDRSAIRSDQAAQVAIQHDQFNRHAVANMTQALGGVREALGDVGLGLAALAVAPPAQGSAYAETVPPNSPEAETLIASTAKPKV